MKLSRLLYLGETNQLGVSNFTTLISGSGLKGITRIRTAIDADSLLVEERKRQIKALEMEFGHEVKPIDRERYFELLDSEVELKLPKIELPDDIFGDDITIVQYEVLMMIKK